MSNIFRAYDVRGLYPDELNEEIAGKIAVATVKFLNAKKLVVGEDARTSSPSVRDSVLKGITEAGCDVYYIGQCTTPLFYFSVNQLGADGGIMVTASHNPPEYNGLKIVGSGATPIASISGLFRIRDMMAEAGDQSSNKGRIQTISFLNEYVNFLASRARIKSRRSKKSGPRPKASGDKNIKFVVDASNGVAPLVPKPLFERLGLNPVLLNFNIDSNFPSHSPDISKTENLEQLKNKILETRADVGFAFDGDADRLTVLDEKGEKLPAEFVVGLLFKAGSGLFRKPKVAYDLRFSRAIRELFGKNGYSSPTGYVFVRKKMEEVDADLGGELAGHFDFKEMNYAESAVLAMLKVVGIIAKESRPLSELVKPFQKYFNSGEVNITLPITNQYEHTNLKQDILAKLKEKYKDGKQSFLDGITVEYWDPDAPVGASWWFNARFSNTEPLMRVVVEAETKELMEIKKAELVSEIKKAPR